MVVSTYVHESRKRFHFRVLYSDVDLNSADSENLTIIYAYVCTNEDSEIDRGSICVNEDAICRLLVSAQDMHFGTCKWGIMHGCKRVYPCIFFYVNPPQRFHLYDTIPKGSTCMCMLARIQSLARTPRSRYDDVNRFGP